MNEHLRLKEILITFHVLSLLKAIEFFKVELGIITNRLFALLIICLILWLRIPTFRVRTRVLKLYHWPRMPWSILVLWVPWRHMRTNGILLRLRSSLRSLWALVMNTAKLHKFLMTFTQLIRVNQPRICHSYLLNLVVKWITEFLLQRNQTISPCCENHQVNSLKAWVFDEVLPNIVGVIGNIFEWWILILILSWVHDQNTEVLVFHSPMNLWQHCSNFKIA